MSAPDFEKLRAERDAAIEAIAREMHVRFGGDPDTPPTFHACGYGGCYCACPDGPCEHTFSGWREFEDGLGGEQVCELCGLGAMSHSLRTWP